MESWSVALGYGDALHAVVQTGSHYATTGFELELRLTGTAGELRVPAGNLMSLEYELATEGGGGWRTVRLPATDYHWARGPVDMARRLRAGGDAAVSAVSTTGAGLVRTIEACRLRTGTELTVGADLTATAPGGGRER
jgi:hypothetical protein